MRGLQGWMGAVLGAGLLFGACGQATSSDAMDPAACTIELEVTGMSCPVGCAPRIQKALASVPGVHSARVTFDDTSAEVVAGPTLCVEGAQAPLIAAVAELEEFSVAVRAIHPATRTGSPSETPPSKTP